MARQVGHIHQRGLSPPCLEVDKQGNGENSREDMYSKHCVTCTQGEQCGPVFPFYHILKYLHMMTRVTRCLAIILRFSDTQENPQNLQY